MWGIVPAAGAGSRIQPLAFSKELLPVGSRIEGSMERPRAVSEYLLERMVQGGATRVCFVVGPGKSDILEYYGNAYQGTPICYAVQQRPAGLCDAIFTALPFMSLDERVVIGLPDTIWFPSDGLARLPDDELSFLLFPVERPELFDAVVTDRQDVVLEVQVKTPSARTAWIWGAFKLPVRLLAELFGLWCERGKRDEYMGTLINAWIARGGRARGVRAGAAYVDVGTLHGYREALRVLAEAEHAPGAAPLHSAGAGARP